MKTKLKVKRGISLIVLVITIIVMIILATAIILSLNSTSIIERANESVIKNDLASVKEQLSKKISDKMVQTNSSNIPKEKITLDGIESKYLGYLEIVNGELCIKANAPENIKAVANKLNIYEGYIIPSEYQEVEYIESTGTQYINTDYILNSNNKIEIDAKINNDLNSINTAIFGSTDNSSSFIQTVTNASIQGFILQNGYNWQEYSVKNNDRNLHIVDFVNNTYTINNVEYNITTEFLYNDYPIYIYARNDKNTGVSRLTNLTLYGCKIYQDNVLVRNLIPCYRKSDNEIGMYDTVEDKFYTNQGTGTFLKGANVN